MGARYNPLRYHKHLRYGDICGKGSILYHGDQRVGKRRESGAHRLRKDNSPHDLQIRHADTVAGFELACRNGFQGRTHRLGTVGALIQGKDENCRRKRIDQNTGARKSVKHNEKLDQKRGSAENPDIETCNLTKAFDVCKLYHSHCRRNYKCNGKRDYSKRNRHLKARQKDFPERIQKNIP